jgi:predicted DNA binding CopG/RHH family protein
MRIVASGFQWDGANRDKCQKHGVAIAEIEDFFERPVNSALGRSERMRKSFPLLKTDEEAEAFLQQDLSDYRHAGNFKRVRFEFLPKQKSINLRLSGDLLNAVRASAKRQGIPYQRYIRQTLERAVTARKR